MLNSLTNMLKAQNETNYNGPPKYLFNQELHGNRLDSVVTLLFSLITLQNKLLTTNQPILYKQTDIFGEIIAGPSKDHKKLTNNCLYMENLWGTVRIKQEKDLVEENCIAPESTAQQPSEEETDVCVKSEPAEPEHVKKEYDNEEEGPCYDNYENPQHISHLDQQEIKTEPQSEETENYEHPMAAENFCKQDPLSVDQTGNNHPHLSLTEKFCQQQMFAPNKTPVAGGQQQQYNSLPPTYQDIIADKLKPKIYKCLQCTFQTKFEFYFRNHLWYEHLTCCYCLHRCTKMDNLSDHMRDKHKSQINMLTVHEAQIQETGAILNNDKPSYVESPIVDNGGLVVQVIKKTPMPLQCLDCAMKSRTVRAMKNHVTAKHPTPEIENFFKCRRLSSNGFYDGPYYNCSIVNCSFNTLNVQLMESHLFRNHVEDPALVSSSKFACDFCSFQTTVRSVFRRHVLRHSPPKELESNFHRCPFCEYRVGQKSYLKNHIRAKHSRNNDEDNNYDA